MKQELNTKINEKIRKVNFPAIITPEGISAEFFLDTTPFNFKYVGINPEVRIKFNFQK